LALGDIDKAFKVLFEMADRGEPGPMFIGVDPPFVPLHSDPRWEDLLRRMSLPRKGTASSS
jgi:hypothetical protein